MSMNDKFCIICSRTSEDNGDHISQPLNFVQRFCQSFIIFTKPSDLITNLDLCFLDFFCPCFFLYVLMQGVESNTKIVRYYRVLLILFDKVLI